MGTPLPQALQNLGSEWSEVHDLVPSLDSTKTPLTRETLLQVDPPPALTFIGKKITNFVWVQIAAVSRISADQGLFYCPSPVNSLRPSMPNGQTPAQPKHRREAFPIDSFENGYVGIFGESTRSIDFRGAEVDHKIDGRKRRLDIRNNCHLNVGVCSWMRSHLCRRMGETIQLPCKRPPALRRCYSQLLSCAAGRFPLLTYDHLSEMSFGGPSHSSVVDLVVIRVCS